MKRILAASLAAAALILGSATAANASPTISNTTISSTITSTACIRAIVAAQSRGAEGLSVGVCTVETTTRTGAETKVRASKLSDLQSNFSADEFKSISLAAAAGTVKSKSYSQTINQITDQETQKGTFYYNGTRVWVTTAYSGYTGTHFCNVDYSAGYSITNTACSDSGSSTSRKLQMNWNVSMVIKGGPISWAASYTMHVSSAGTATNG